MNQQFLLQRHIRNAALQSNTLTNEIPLEGFDDRIVGLDGLGGELLLIDEAPAIQRFDATTGARLGTIALSEAAYGLDCAAR